MSSTKPTETLSVDVEESHAGETSNATNDEAKDTPSSALQHLETDATGKESSGKTPETTGTSFSEDWNSGDNDEGSESCLRKACQYLLRSYKTHEFLILVLFAIVLARAYPPLGATYLAPHITTTWIAVVFLFLLVGLGLKTDELFSSTSKRNAFFDLLVGLYSFGVDSAAIFGLCLHLTHHNILDQDLADGMVIAATLPMTTNACVVLTKASGGDASTAIANTALWNLVGVALSPTLMMVYTSLSGSTFDIPNVVTRLAISVLIPIAVGQLLKFWVPPIQVFVKNHKSDLKQAQLYSLVFVVYTAFCQTFAELLVPVKETFLMVVFVGLSLVVLMTVAWFVLQVFFRKQVKLRVMGLYGCTHKTVAIGIPLIHAVYDGNPSIGFYILPLLIWHPMQLLAGAFLAPRMSTWVESVEEADYQRAKKEFDREHGDCEQARQLETASTTSMEVEV